MIFTQALVTLSVSSLCRALKSLYDQHSSTIRFDICESGRFDILGPDESV